MKAAKESCGLENHNSVLKDAEMQNSRAEGICLVALSIIIILPHLFFRFFLKAALNKYTNKVQFKAPVSGSRRCYLPRFINASFKHKFSYLDM